MQLRDYQIDCQTAIKNSFDQGINRQLVALPTGTGKTVIFAHLPQTLGVSKAIVLAHREELLDQARDKIQSVNPDLRVEVEQADRRASAWADIIVASVATIGRKDSPRIERFDPNQWPLIICDEAHHSIASTYINVFNYFGIFTDPKKLLVGVTATPNRGDKVGLAEVYQNIVFQRNLREMITAKWLCPITAYRIITGSDLTGVRIQHGDFVDADLAEAVNTPERNQLAVDSYKCYCEGRRALVFCVDKNHTRDMADAFKKSGIPCGIVLGDTNPDERAYTLRQLAEGKIKVVANCMVLTEGYDLPTLSCIIMARPTKSGLLYTQCIGRGTRIHPEKQNLIVIDLTDNSQKHQLISLPSLLGLPLEFAIQGKDVIETVNEFDRLQAKHPGVPLSEARSIEDIERIIQKFDILKAAAIDPNVANYSKFTWISTPDGFSIYISETKAQISIKENLLGKFELTESAPGVINRIATAESLESAFIDGDRHLENHYPQLTGMFAQRARWRQDGITEAQSNLLRKLGINFPQGTTKGQASILISSHLAKSKVRY